MRLTALFMAIALLGAQTARAGTMEVVSPQADAVSVTIYRDLFALITETRTVDLPEGPLTLSFEGVVETLLPESAVVTDLGRALAERNFDYDALTPDNLLTKSIGKSVTLTRTLPGAGRVVQTHAVIVAANSGGITLRTEQGDEALHCSGLPERLTFDEVPDDLHARPTLSIRLAAGNAGKHTIRLSYLAYGFAWNADYVARLNAAGNRMGLTGWVTLQNYTQANLRSAQVQVVAGKLHLIARERGGSSLTGDSDRSWNNWNESEEREEARQTLQQALEPKDSTLQLFSGCHALPVPDARKDRRFEGVESMDQIIVTGFRRTLQASMQMSRSAMVTEREELGDYQLYRLPWATDLNARQTKQAVFLARPRVKIDRYYSYSFNGRDVEDLGSSSPRSMIAFDNRKSSGLGEPLPEGNLRVFEATATGDFFAGESYMQDTAVNLPVELSVASSLDLGVEVDVESATPEELRDTNFAERADVELRALNAKTVPVTLEIRQYANTYVPTSSIATSSEPVRRKDGDFVWRLRVPANGTKLLTYRFERRDEPETD